MSTDVCLFCLIVTREVPSEIIFEDRNVFAFLDINPVNPGHTLVIPKVHATNIQDISKESLASVMEVVRMLSPKIKHVMRAEGINIIMNNEPAAGQIVFHAHVHIIPRFKTDGLHHWKGTPYKPNEQSETAIAIRNELSA